MRTTTVPQIKQHDPEAARRLYDDAVAEIDAPRSLIRGGLAGFALVGIIVAIAVTLKSWVLS